HLLQQLTAQLGVGSECAAGRPQRRQTLQQQLAQCTARPPASLLAQPFTEELEQGAQQQTQQQNRPPAGARRPLAGHVGRLQPMAEQIGNDPALQDEQHGGGQSQHQGQPEQTTLSLYQPLQ